MPSLLSIAPQIPVASNHWTDSLRKKIGDTTIWKNIRDIAVMNAIVGGVFENDHFGDSFSGFNSDRGELLGKPRTCAKFVVYFGIAGAVSEIVYTLLNRETVKTEKLSKEPKTTAIKTVAKKIVSSTFGGLVAGATCFATFKHRGMTFVNPVEELFKPMLIVSGTGALSCQLISYLFQKILDPKTKEFLQQMNQSIFVAVTTATITLLSLSTDESFYLRLNY